MQTRPPDSLCSRGVQRTVAARFAWLSILLTCSAAGGGLGRYAELIKADPPPLRSAPPASGVRITYLGTNGYLLESRDAILLVDPYFSRQSLARSALNLAAILQPKRVDGWVREHPHIDGVLVTHGHVDHLLDVPQILRATNAQLIASQASVALVRSVGVSDKRLHPVRGGDVRHVAGATVRVVPATHDRVLGRVPFNGPIRNLPPRKVGDWITGEPLAFLIEIGGKNLFIHSGAGPGAREIRTRPVDIAILGVATPDSVRALPAELDQLRPRFVVPSHQDNFFQPLERGFSFLPFTNFPAVRKAVGAQHAKVVLLEYFRPWTLR